MKRILTILAVVAAIAACALTSSCKKSTPTDGLAGTSWIYSAAGIGMEFQFLDNNQVKYITRLILAEIQTETFEGTYKYEAPNVTITINGESATGVIDGDELTMTIEEIPFIFTKK